MRSSDRIKLHPLTVFILFVAVLTGYIKYLVLIFAIVIIHELGHVFFAILFKRKVNSITLLPFGGMTKMSSKISENIFEDLLIAVGGLFGQTIFGFILILLNNFSLINRNTYEFLNMYNMFIISFNLLPMCPLDGYKIVKLASELFVPFKFSFTISSVISFSLLGFLALTNRVLFVDNIFIFTFLVFMTIEEIKNRDFLANRFYVERMNYDFYYRRKDIRKKENMYKNRINYINGEHEKGFLKKFFTSKSN